MDGDRAWSCALGVVASAAVIAACSGGDGSNAGDGGQGDPGPASGLDVAVSDLQAPASASAGERIDVAVRVHNRGSLPASPAVMFVLSADDEIGIDDPMLNLVLPRLMFRPGESIDVETTLTVPENLGSSTLHLGAIAPPHPDEDTPGDNAVGRPLEIHGVDCDGDPFEPDDSLAQAPDADFGTRQGHNFCDDDRDFVRLMADADDRFAFAVTNREDEAHAQLTLLDGDGEALERLELDDAGVARWTAPERGVFYVVASSALGLLGTGADTGYDLLVGRDLPDIAMEEAFFGTSETNPGGRLTASVSLAFSSPEQIGAFDVAVMLSDDDRITTDDRMLRVLRAAGPADFDVSYPIEATVPADVMPGSYFLGAVVDPDDALAELDDTNNTSAATAIQVIALACSPDAHEENDYADAAAELPLDQAQTHNLCDEGSDWFRFDADAGTEYRLLLESARALDFEIELFDAAGAALGEPYRGSLAWTAPADGTYLMLVSNAGFPGPVGTDDAYTVTRLLPMADLVASKLDPWAGLTSGASAPVDIGVDNQGGADGSDFRLAVYLSADDTVTTDDRLVGEVASVSVDWDGVRTMGYQLTVALDASVAAGDYTLGLMVDPDDRIAESNEDNNLLTTPVSVQ